MPLTIPAATSQPILVKAEPLTAESFKPFGTAISNPQRPEQAISANQGSALKYVDISPLLDFYDQAPSRVPSKAAMNMFVCSPRNLEKGKAGEKVFKVGILERHPFTTQTFCPLGLGKDEDTKFLVIVAPSLKLSELDIGLPVPRSAGDTGVRLPGRGLPDLSKMRAFLADGSQAVTYGAGTWHAPMVVLGTREVAFVVTQFVNGVGEEDCQEVVWEGDVKVSVETAEGKKYEDQMDKSMEAVVASNDAATGVAEMVTDRLGEERKKAIHGDRSGKPKL